MPASYDGPLALAPGERRRKSVRPAVLPRVLRAGTRTDPAGAAVRRLSAALADEDRGGLAPVRDGVEAGGAPAGPGPTAGQDTKRRTTDTPAAAIIRAHRRRRSSLEETMLALYYGNLSPYRAEETARTLWGERLDGAVVAACVGQIRERLRAWLRQPIEKHYAYVFLDTIRIRQRVAGQARETGMPCAVGLDADGRRDVLGLQGETAGGPAGWSSFLRDLRKRGLADVGLFVGGLDEEMRQAVAGEFPAARRQVCLVQLEREILARVPSHHLHTAMTLCGAVHRGGDGEAARVWIRRAAHEFRRLELSDAAALLERIFPDAAGYTHFPRGHWPQIRTTEAIKRMLSPFRERIRVIGPIAEPEALTLMAAAHLRQVARSVWNRRRGRKAK